MAKTQQERNDASKAKDAERGAEDLRLKTFPGTAAALATLMQRHGIDLKGDFMKIRKKTKLVYGVGANDADYHTAIGAAIDGRWKLLWVCPLYEAWKGMLRRCYSKKLHARNPTYIGCSVAHEWLSFSAFRSWALTQDHEGKQLDKDILIPGNKVYSPDTCVFVPRELNCFMSDSSAARGDLQIGVDWHLEKFRASCNNPFTRKQECLGHFDNQSSAHAAWRARKYEHACTYAEMQTDQRIADALRSRYATEAA